MADLTCSDYSEKAVVVRGDTKTHKEGLKNLGGKFNASLKDGAGWIFPKKLEGKIQEYITGFQAESKTAVKPSVPKDLMKDGMVMIKNSAKNMSVSEKIAFVNAVMVAVFGEEPERPRQPHPVNRYPKPVSKLTERKSSDEQAKESAVSDSEDDDEVVPKVLPKAKPKAKSVVSDSEDDEVVVPKAKPKAKSVVSDSDDEVVVPRKRLLKGY
jgi:hypothetical protein